LVKTKTEVTFVYLNIANSIEAFILSKQRAVKDTGNLFTVLLNIQERFEEEEMDDDENKGPQYDMMMKDLQEFNIE